MRTFWQQYLDQSGQEGVDVEYDGVSLLEFDDEGRVARFATYYDTAALAHRLG